MSAEEQFVGESAPNTEREQQDETERVCPLSKVSVGTKWLTAYLQQV